MHPQFLRQRHNVVALLQAGDGVLLERLWKFAHTFLGHLPPPLGVKCANSPCLNLGVQSTLRLGGQKVLPSPTGLKGVCTSLDSWALTFKGCVVVAA